MSRAKAKPLSPSELYNADYMKSEFKEREEALRSTMDRASKKMALYENIKKRVENARNSTARNRNKSSAERNNALKKKYRNIHQTLKNSREYAMHVNNKGEVTPVQAPSFVNTILRKSTIEKFNDKKNFPITPEATIHRKSDTRPPREWRSTDPPMKEHTLCGITLDLLSGSAGKWKRDDAFLKEGSSVIFKLVGPNKLLIKGVFKEYSPAEIAAHPDLKYCSERFWVKSGIMYAEEGIWEPPPTL